MSTVGRDVQMKLVFRAALVNACRSMKLSNNRITITIIGCVGFFRVRITDDVGLEE